jgi:hypothetical protein
MLRRRWLALLLPWLVLLVFPLAGRVPPAAAANAVVGPPCQEANFDSALATVQGSGGGAITFNCGSSPFVLEIANPKVITSNVTIDGGGRADIRGVNTLMFSVQGGAALTLTRITISGGSNPLGDGGAIYNGGTLVILGSTFRDNHAGVNVSGGAIVSYGPLTITNSLFENNSAGNGGALFPRFLFARTTIRNTIFRGNYTVNSVNGWGGAILAWDGAPVTIEGGEFYTNTARDGGAIYNTFTGENSTVALNNVAIHDNLATNLRGGGIYNAGRLTMTGGELNGNLATGSGSSGGGGLANVAGGVANLTDVRVRFNHSSGDGGGLLNHGAMTLNGGDVLGNTAVVLGGGGFISGTILTMNGTAVTANEALQGGGLYVNRGSVYLNNLVVADNSAGINGGGVFSQGYLQLNSAELRGNEAQYSGGGLYVTYDGSPTGGLTDVEDTTVAANAASDGGGIYVGGGELQAVNLRVTQNRADRGAGVRVSDGNLIVLRGTLWANQARHYGGGLHADLGEILLLNVTVSGNSAGLGGGGLRSLGTGPILLKHVTFSGNSARSGGGMQLLAGSAPITLTNTIVAYSPSGGNCNGAITAAKYSLSSDLTCALPGAGNLLNTDPLLTGLGNYGGLTLAHMPKANSPAIDGVVGSDALTTDQRGLPRPVLPGFDIGAIERQPNDIDIVPHLWAPLARR